MLKVDKFTDPSSQKCANSTHWKADEATSVVCVLFSNWHFSAGSQNWQWWQHNNRMFSFFLGSFHFLPVFLLGCLLFYVALRNSSRSRDNSLIGQEYFTLHVQERVNQRCALIISKENRLIISYVPIGPFLHTVLIWRDLFDGF